MTDGDFEGRRAVVTGGDRGMGHGIAVRLAQRGAALCLVARNVDDLTAVRAEIEALGSTCSIISADLSSVEGATSAAAQAVEFGPWDILVNDAGNPPGPLLLDLPVELWDETFGVHVRAPFLLAQALVPAMIDQGGGDILNISSTASTAPAVGHGAYSPAKSALEALTANMALEWGQHNIRANAIRPTLVLTKLGREVWGSHPRRADWLRAKIPAGRFGEVDDIVDLAEFLLGPNNRFINGAVIPCDGGMSTGFADGPPEG